MAAMLVDITSKGSLQTVPRTKTNYECFLSQCLEVCISTWSACCTTCF